MTTTTTPARRRQPNAATVSSALRKAGFDRASDYRPFSDRETHGFVVTWGDTDRTKVTVVNTSASRVPADKTREIYAIYAAALRAAGFMADVNIGHGYGRRAYGVTVKQWT